MHANKIASVEQQLKLAQSRYLKVKRKLKLPDLKFNITAIYQSKSKGTSRNMRIMIKKNKTKKHHDQQKTRYYHVQTL